MLEEFQIAELVLRGLNHLQLEQLDRVKRSIIMKEMIQKFMLKITTKIWTNKSLKLATTAQKN